MSEFEPLPPPSSSDTPYVGASRRWRDVLFFGVICLALVSPWIGGMLLHRPSLTAPVPQAPAPVALSLPPRLPQDPVEQLALGVAQQGLREVLAVQDSSAPPPVFDPAKIRIDHPGKDVWMVTGVVTTAWQTLMAEPHLYKVEIYRVCHIMAAPCFKTRGVTVDSEVILAP